MIRATWIQGVLPAVLLPSTASASSSGEFIGTAFWVFAAYCALILGPHAVRAIRVLWKEAKSTREAKRQTAADS